jgi:hypothetical protein
MLCTCRQAQADDARVTARDTHTPGTSPRPLLLPLLQAPLSITPSGSRRASEEGEGGGGFAGGLAGAAAAAAGGSGSGSGVDGGGPVPMDVDGEGSGRPPLLVANGSFAPLTAAAGAAAKGSAAGGKGKGGAKGKAAAGAAAAAVVPRGGGFRSLLWLPMRNTEGQVSWRVPLAVYCRIYRIGCAFGP